jgi:hypothetical protein
VGARGRGLSARKVTRSRALHVRCDKVRRPLAREVAPGAQLRRTSSRPVRRGPTVDWDSVWHCGPICEKEFLMRRLMFSAAFVCYPLVAVAGFAAA